MTRCLLVLGNSVSMVPEKEDRSVRPYPTLLADRLAAEGWRVADRSVSGATTPELETVAAEALASAEPDAVVLQTGITDCTPRPLRQFERNLLAHVRPDALRNWFVRLIHDHRAAIIMHRRLIQSTSLEVFTASCERLFERCSGAGRHVAVLPIFPATATVRARNPLVSAEIDRYNGAIQRTASGPRLLELPELFGSTPIEELEVRPDSVHLNQRGHELVARALLSWLKSLPIEHSPERTAATR